VPESDQRLGNNGYPEYLLQNGVLRGNGQVEFATIGTMRRISFPYVALRRLKVLIARKMRGV
jgi:hypothetical protein